MRVLVLGFFATVATFVVLRLLFSFGCIIAHSSLEDIAGAWVSLVFAFLYGILAAIWFKTWRKATGAAAV